MKFQKKLLYVAIICSLFLGMRGSVYAHPPKIVTAEYDFKTNILYIRAEHRVKTVSKHFIDKIEVELNGKTLVVQNMRSQGDEYVQELQYKVVDIKDGDKLYIKTACNKWGTKKTKITIKAPQEKPLKGKRSKKKK